MIFTGTVKKSIAVLLILITLGNVVAPTVSYALTSGPTAPEATSFEPVDTTDMVNLLTGDMVYNIPLLEVPGPAGGYPLSLSYHAGIQTNEDASWVGLGWTLNPGAITRTVNGYPDDQVGAIRTRHDLNSGGERNTFTLGVGYAGAMYRLSYSNDTNLGVGIGFGMGAGYTFGLGKGVGLSVDASAGIDGYGNLYGGASAGLSFGKSGKEAQGLTAHIGVSTNFNSASLAGGIGYGNNKTNKHRSLLGASISSEGMKPSLGVAGFSMYQTSSFAGRVTTEGWGIHPPPVYIYGIAIELGYDYLRYYSDETSNVNLIGTLNAPSTSGKNPDDWAFDSYALLDIDNSGVAAKYDPEKSKGGSFPAYDAYNVTAQGLGGSIQPYILNNGTLFRQNLKNTDGGYIIKYNGPSRDNSYGFYSPVNFRFKNDFSNTFSYDNVTMREYQGNLSFNNNSPTMASDGYYNGHLAGSKHIEYFTNQQIKEGVAKSKGFVDYKPSAERQTNFGGYDIANQVGGFMITNESGVTYHYALPVYAYGQYSKTFKTGKENDIFQEIKEAHPYAYTWFLTAVTGPDYTSRNTSDDGTISANDWGYWVTFNYNLHASNYTWRNPIEGTHRDIDQQSEYYSYGTKEIYYLDKIETQTHVAVFQKSVRLDGKGVTNSVAGGFQSIPYQQCESREREDHGWEYYNCQTNYINPGTTLKLDHLLLLNRSDYESGGDLNSKAIRIIDFNTDYSLTPGTTNSFPENDIDSKKGKLTLTSLKFRGKSGAGSGSTSDLDLIPPITFEYGKNPSFNKDAFDMWGYYKPDFNPSDPNSVSRFVTSASSAQVDAWSLTSIGSSTGAKIDIEYESDSYQKPVLHQIQNFNVSKFTLVPNTNDQVELELAGNVDMLREYFNVGDAINLKYLDKYNEWIAFENLSDPSKCTPPNGIPPWANYLPGNRILKISEKGIKADGNFYIRFKDSEEYAIHKSDYVFPISQLPIQEVINVETQCCPYACDSNGDGKSDELCYTTISTPYFCNYTRIDARGPSTFIAGNIAKIGSEEEFEILGGGLRVKQIKVSNLNSSRFTKFGYKQSDIASGASGTSGYTSYEPGGANLAKMLRTDVPEDTENTFENFLNDRFYATLRIAREIPGPGVMYKNVSIEEFIQQDEDSSPIKVPGKKVYEFQVFDENFVQRIGITSSNAPYTASCRYADHEPASTNCDSYGEAKICIDQFGNPINCGVTPSKIYTPLTLKDYSSWVGSLKKVTVYDDDERILTEVTTQYLHDEKTTDQFASDLKSKFKNQGVITQLFNEYRDVDGISMPVFSRRDEYPLVSVGQITKDYKLGTTSSTENLAFDFYTGNPTKVLTSDGYGNTFVSETIPAYAIPEYSGMTNQQITAGTIGMGLKIKNIHNKHMLTQTVGSVTYKVNSDYKSNPVSSNKLGLVSAMAQTWSDQTPVLNQSPQTGIWRMKSSYSFIGDETVALRDDGLYPPSSFTEFNNWTDDSNAPATWQKNAEITLYDTYSHALEASDVNGKYASTRMTIDQTRVSATAANAQYNEMGYTGAEDKSSSSFEVDYNNFWYDNGLFTNYDDYGGGVFCPSSSAQPANSAVRVNTKAHSGTSSILAQAGSQAFAFFPTGNPNTYHVSFWSSASDAVVKYRVSYDGTITDAHARVKGTAGGWYLIEADVTIPRKAIYNQIWCEASSTATYFDDFRVHPFNSSMTSYVYNSWGELSHILNANNLYTKYEYDGMGRLVKTYQETFQPNYGNQGVAKVSEVNYHYKASQPFTVSLNSSTTGVGAISPLGSVNVEQGKAMAFNIEELCTTPKFQKLFIDSKEINLSQPSITLFDGTGVNVSGKQITLTNVQSGHTVQAQFDAGFCGGGVAQITAPITGTQRSINICDVTQDKSTTINVTMDGGPYTYQWEYQYSASGSIDWKPVGTNSASLNYTQVGVNASATAIRCKTTDDKGVVRYSSEVVLFYECPGQPGPGSCPTGCTWNSQQGKCDCSSTCAPGCFWNFNTSSCSCQ